MKKIVESLSDKQVFRCVGWNDGLGALAKKGNQSQ